jgi:DNA-binding NarL/FixJ family response regulator
MKALIAGRSPIIRDSFLQKVQESLHAELLAPALDQRRGPRRDEDPDIVIFDARQPDAEDFELVMTLHQDRSLLIVFVLTPSSKYQIETACWPLDANFIVSPRLTPECLIAALRDPTPGVHSGQVD